MPTTSLPEPPPPFHCDICAKPEHALKAGPGCQACPAFKGTHYFPFSEGSDFADIVVVGDAPYLPPKPPSFIKNNRVELKSYHSSFQEDGTKVLQTAIKAVQQRYPAYTAFNFKYVYGVRCAVDSPNKNVIQACRTPLKMALTQLAAKRQAMNSSAGVATGALTVLACGVNALHSLGIPVRSEREALGRVYKNVQVGDVVLNVVFTRSLKALAASVGIYSTILADVERALRLAAHEEVLTLPREEIEKNYIYPKTIEEVKALVDLIIGYTENGVDPLNWKVSADTETNTLHPHWSGTKLIAVSFSWAKGKATTIPLWHKDTPYDPAEAFKEVCRIFDSGKPLVWMNAKYDFKVFWRLGLPQRSVGKIAWDTLCGEHVLEEDSKGFYGLKHLTKRDIPELAGYEDRLHELRELADSEEFTAVKVSEKRTVKLPRAIAEALLRSVEAQDVKDGNFKVDTVRKLLTNTRKAYEIILSPEGLKLDKTPDITASVLDAVKQRIKDLELLIVAKENGEFTGKSAKEAAKERERKGGFEDVPLDELSFYAAVDADATRRIAVRQKKRMHDEDDKYDAWRLQVRSELAFAMPGSKDAGKQVNVLCTHPEPLVRLLTEDYLPRQTELAKIEYNGLTIDREYLHKGSQSLDVTIGKTEQSVYELCEDKINLNSGKQVANFLFFGGVGFKHPDPELAEEIARNNPDTVRYQNGRMTYKAQHYTEKGAMQTGEAVLKHLVTRYKCPLSNLLMTLNKANKARFSFFENIGLLADMFGDNRIHPGYNITGTSTGRLSSSSGVQDIGFNQQNIPKGLLGALKNWRGEFILGSDGKPLFEGVKCKKLFIPDDDSMCFGNADAKGAEVSIFAGYAMDESLIRALCGNDEHPKGMDAHCFFASQCLNPALVTAGLTGEQRRIALANAGIDEDHEWSYQDFFLGKDGLLPDKEYGKRLKALRDNIKRLVFGLLFGAGVTKIADIAGISLDLAKQIKKLLFNKFPTLERFIEQTIWEMRTFGIVETYHGRRRRFSLGASSPPSLRAKAERQAVNFKIQGTNSDIVMTVLCWVAEVIERDLGGRLLLTVHDSIGFQVPKKYAHQVPEIFKLYGTKKVAEACPWLPVPYRWDVELGSSYGSVMPAEEYLKNLPMPLAAPELDGYTEEEIFEDLRDHEEHETSLKHPKKVQQPVN